MRKHRFLLLPSFPKRQRRVLLIGMALAFIAGPIAAQILFLILTRLA